MCRSFIVVQTHVLTFRSSANFHYSSLFFLAIRLEEKIFDMESENQILRQQALLTPAKRVSDHSPSPASKVLTRGKSSFSFFSFLLTNTVNKFETMFCIFR